MACETTRARRRLGAAAKWAFAAVALTLMAVAALFFASPPALAFTDVTSSKYSGEYSVQIQVMAQLGVVNGFGDGTFRPNDSVTRQQFAKMLVAAMRIPVSESDKCAFADVAPSGPNSLYPDNYIAALSREGIATGVTSVATSGLFKPDDTISLAQLITMCVRAADTVRAKAEASPLPEPPSSYRATWGNFGAPHYQSARKAQYNGLLRELPLSQMNPWRPATRAEAAALLFNLMGTDPESICGRFLGTSGDLVRYFRSKVPSGEKFSVSVEELARLYDEYCRRFGIRADVAWVQMCHETAFGWALGQGDVRPEQNNFAGIGATGGGVPGNTFARAELGVIAHVVHLAWYAYPDHLDDDYCRWVVVPTLETPITTPGDPRHFVWEGRPHRGGARTVLDLSEKWAVGSAYGATLRAMMANVPVTRGW